MQTSPLKNIIEYKKANIENTIRAGRRELAELEKQEQNIGKRGIEKWLGNEFESSSQTTPEFAMFAREYRIELKKKIAGKFELVDFSRGHFYISGFVQNIETKKFVYFSTSDVRYNSGDCWYNNILVRTAKHAKDYTGGSNNWATWKNLLEQFTNLSK